MKKVTFVLIAILLAGLSYEAGLQLQKKKQSLEDEAFIAGCVDGATISALITSSMLTRGMMTIAPNPEEALVFCTNVLNKKKEEAK